MQPLPIPDLPHVDPHTFYAALIGVTTLTTTVVRLLTALARIARRADELVPVAAYNLVHRGISVVVCRRHGRHRLRDHYRRQRRIRADFDQLTRYS